MLDTKKVGIKICTFRKNTGYSQEKLAEILRISPQAISKWENGHALPETSLLPVLAQIFGCSIDEIIMPAYVFDEKIEIEKPDSLEKQAEHIAKYVIKKLEKNKKAELSDNIIAGAVTKANNIFGDYTINRGKSSEAGGRISTNITVIASEKEIKLLEVYYKNKDREFNNFVFLNEYRMKALPHIYFVDKDKKIILHEDLSDDYIRGYDFDEDNENGVIIRSNYDSYLCAAANYHRIFWESRSAFERIGLPWHFEAKENMLAWIHNAMEKPFNKYKKDEESGKIPRENNNITKKQFDYFDQALEYLKTEYVKLIDSRFHAGKNITVIHGDLHPGQMLMSKDGKKVKFIDVEAVRMGLCTDDLAMLIALHIASDTDIATSALDSEALREYIQTIKKSDVTPLLDSYYNCLNETLADYSYETFISDYRISIAENMFFTFRLINDGIFDFKMRDKAIRAFELFVLEER